MSRRPALLISVLVAALAVTSPAAAATLQGRLKVVHVDPGTSGKPGSYRYFVRAREVRFADAPALAPGQRVRVEGEARRDVLHVQDADALGAAPGAVVPAAAVTGTDDVLVLPMTDTVPDETTVARMQAQMGEDATFYARSSYGAYGQRFRVAPWLRVPPQPGGCAYYDYVDAAETAARAQGIEPNGYERVMVYLGPGVGECGFGGAGEVAGRYSWITSGNFNRYVTVHELGHNVGLWHAHSLRCHDGTGAEVTLGQACEPFDEYGDVFDTMGHSEADFNAAQKDVLGWLPSRTAAVPTPLTAARTFSLTPMSATSGLKGLRIGTRPLWVEYRRPAGNDVSLGRVGAGTDGVLLHVPEVDELAGFMNGTNLLDGRPRGDGSFWDAPLPAGARFDDPMGAFSLRVNSLTASAASVTVMPSVVAGWAYANAAQPTAASYTPTVQGSSHGGQVTVQRTGVGAYAVLLRRAGFAGAAVHVTATGAGGAWCRVAQTRVTGTDLLADVACHTPAGAAANAPFTISTTRQVGTAAPFATVVAGEPQTPSYAPAGAFSSAGGAPTVTRNAIGTYLVRLPGLGGWGGTVQVSTASASAGACLVAGWRADGGDQTANVRCFTAGGARVDAGFVLTYARGTGMLGPGERVGAYALADQPTAAAYAPKPPYTFNSTGGATAITRSAPGSYAVRFAGVAAAARRAGVAHATAYGSDGSRCKVASHAASGADTVVEVACRTAAGAPADRPFTVGWTA